MDYSTLKIPNHVAIILDGNGRWAVKRGLKRTEGHLAGYDNLRKISEYILSKNIKILSVFAFSTENFKRSSEEVDFLMNLFMKKLGKDGKYFKEKNIKVVFSGRKEPLSDKVYNSMKKLEADTSNCTGGILNICLNYGGQSEIIDACKKIVLDTIDNKISIENINEELFPSYLYNDLGPVDFMIRTSGEVRISNFMLWQLSYAELYFPDVYFPDFNEQEFDKCILEYTSRDRRYGGINYKSENN